ncbi:MAG: hypothetical protein CVV42_15005 [Candidatus Riflebacteria bacterium HGW-Riflebacteria-2]|jgi:hypothetical protein|nr:MAG: hypothetical protein CVV42_15005 [Candidatus Riflebacteria bacterium HGW-Riflebacteria-2]
MQPQACLSLPEAIRSDISIYLAPEEKVLKAIKSDAERTASKGQVWLILSTGSVIFHTCEIGREPIIALLARRDIREIEYFQRLKEVVLTFVPARSPQNVTRLSFANEQRPELEDFCDDLAELISFKKETVNGVKTYSSPTPAMPVDSGNADKAGVSEAPPSSLRNAASAVKHSAKSVTESRPKVEPVAPTTASSELKPDVKIAKTPEIVAVSEDRPVSTVSATTRPAKEPVAKEPVAAGVHLASSALSGSAAGIRISYVIAATVISVLVGFLWYKFFSSLARIKD